MQIFKNSQGKITQCYLNILDKQFCVRAVHFEVLKDSPKFCNKKFPIGSYIINDSTLVKQWKFP